MPLFFQNFYYLVPKIEICLKYFLDKNSQWSSQSQFPVPPCQRNLWLTPCQKTKQEPKLHINPNIHIYLWVSEEFHSGVFKMDEVKWALQKG